MGAAIEQSVTHLVVSQAVVAKDVQNTKDTAAPDGAFSDLMAREDEEAAPEKNAKAPEKPIPPKDKPQDTSAVKERDVPPQEGPLDLEVPPLEEVSFPKTWADKLPKDEMPQKAQTTDVRDIETLDKRLGQNPLEDTIITRTAQPLEDLERQTQILAESGAQDVAEGAIKDVTEGEVKDLTDTATPQPPVIHVAQSPEKTPIILENTPGLEKAPPRPQREETMDRQVLLTDEALARDTLDDVEVDLNALLDPKSLKDDTLEQEALRAQPSPASSKKERDLKGANTGRTQGASSDVRGSNISAPEPLESTSNLDLNALLESSDRPFSLTHLGESKGEGMSFTAGSTRDESFSQIMLQKGASPQEAGQPTLMRTPHYTLVQVDVKMPSLNESGTLKMRLDPGHLGRVEVEVTLTHDGRLDAVVNVSKSETFEMMRHDSDALARVIADAFGGELGTLDFSLSQDGQDNTPLFDKPPHGRGAPHEAALSQAVLAFQTQQLDPARMLDALA